MITHYFPNGQIDLSSQNANRVQDLAQAIRATDNASQEFAALKAQGILDLLDKINQGKVADPGEAINHALTLTVSDVTTGVAAADTFLRRASMMVQSSLQQGDIETAYEASSRIRFVVDTPHMLEIIQLTAADRQALSGLINALQNAQLEHITAQLEAWESHHENLGISNLLAGASERIDAYNMGMANPNAKFEDIMGAMHSTSQDEFEKYAGRFLTDMQMSAILGRVNDILADTGAGLDVANITQQTIGLMLGQMQMIADDLEFSKKLEDDLDKAIDEAKEKDDGDKYSSISEAIPEGFFAAVGVSDDSKVLAEMLTGVREYDPETVKTILTENPKLAKSVAAFFTSHA